MRQPLIRLKVEHTGFDVPHVRRFGKLFARDKLEDLKVANPYNLLSFWRKKVLNRNARRGTDGEDAAVGDSKGEILEAPEISTLVEEELHKNTQNSGLQVLFESDIFNAVEQFVEKGDGKAIEKMLNDSLQTVKDEFMKEVGAELAAVENDEFLREAVNERLQKRREAHEQDVRQTPGNPPISHADQSQASSRPSQQAPNRPSESSENVGSSSRSQATGAGGFQPRTDDSSDDEVAAPVSDRAGGGRGRGGRGRNADPSQEKAKGKALKSAGRGKAQQGRQTGQPKGQMTLAFQSVSSQPQASQPGSKDNPPKRQRRAAAVAGSAKSKEQAHDKVEIISDNDDDFSQNESSSQSVRRARGIGKASAGKRRRDQSSEEDSDDGGAGSSWAKGGTRG
mmetsp:Transcript_32859/g.51235  ORF Transcript_32859/g.51235 Transcript_32859/m.51235 type:complete len:395 (+) Transcript_32859:198-1382(+)